MPGRVAEDFKGGFHCHGAGAGVAEGEDFHGDGAATLAGVFVALDVDVWVALLGSGHDGGLERGFVDAGRRSLTLSLWLGLEVEDEVRLGMVVYLYACAESRTAWQLLHCPGVGIVARFGAVSCVIRVP